MTDFRLRNATLEDAPALARLYGHYVRTTAFTFEDAEPSAEEMARRLRKILEGGMPYLIAEAEGLAAEKSGVAGFAYAAPFRARSAYRFTVENSVYVAPDQAGQGIGTALMQKLITDCAARGFCQMVALIGDAQNTASVALHRRLGFQPAGHLRAVGFKFGRWVDVIEMQLPLGSGTP